MVNLTLFKLRTIFLILGSLRYLFNFSRVAMWGLMDKLDDGSWEEKDVATKSGDDNTLK